MQHAIPPMSFEVAEARRDLLGRYEGPTRSSVTIGIDRFLSWCAQNDIDALEAKRLDIQDYSSWLQHDQLLKKSTTAGYLTSVSMFYRLAEADDRIAKNPMLMVRRPKVHYSEDRMRGLNRHDSEKIILAASRRSPQHLALVVLLANLGLRASEVGRVTIAGISGTEGVHRVLRVMRKGGKPQTMPLPPLILRPILAAVGNRTEGALIETRNGRPVTRHDVYRRVEVLGRQAGLGHVHPHMLRHAAISQALDAGAPPRSVQVFANHGSLSTTERYDRTRGSLDAHAVHYMQMHLSSVSSVLAA